MKLFDCAVEEKLVALPFLLRLFVLLNWRLDW
jgi:hypothetical protein